MARLIYTAPLLIGLLSLAGCPGTDPAPADTDSNGDSTGPDPGTTTNNPTTNDPTTIDPDSGSGDTMSATTDVMTCDPACEAGQCCVNGFCFDEPEPTCEPECAKGEICAYPDGADACDADAMCMEDVGLCPGGWGAGNYDDCLNDMGVGDDSLCEAGSVCVTDAADPTLTACIAQDCSEMCDCPEPPDSGDAPVACADVTDDMVNDCYLSCENDETCPAGMNCFDSRICVWPVPQPGPGYLNCSLTGLTCQPGEDCLNDGDGGGMAATTSVCSQPGCMTEMDCEFAAPTSDAPVTCGDPTGMGGANTCYLSCAMAEECPNGMTCINDSWCSWPAGDTLFFDDFQTADFSMGWTLIDVDAQVPNRNVAFVNDAWVVLDNFDGGAGGNLAAYSNSWYAPPGQADDWMVSPQVMIGANAQLQWRARAQDPAFPDGYEVLISTAGPAVADFTDPPVFTIANEEATGEYVFRTVDLAPTYANQMIYVAFRNNSNDQFILLVDDVALVDFP